MVDVGTLVMKIEADTKNFSKGLNVANESIAKMGKAMAVGGAVVGSVIAGIGVASFKVSEDIQKASNQIAAATNATEEEMSGLEDSMKRIYANNFGEGFEEIADVLTRVKQNTSLVGAELEATAQNALMFQDVFGYGTEETIRAADALMKNFELDSTRAFELIALGAQNGADKNGDLLDTLNEYAPQFESLGFSADSFLETLIDGSDAGLFSMDKLGDAIKEFNIRSKDMSDSSADAFQSLGFDADDMFKRFSLGGDDASMAFQDTMESLQKIKDPLEQNRIGVELFGTQFEDLEAGVVDVLANLDGKMKDSEENIWDMKGALDKMNEIKYDTFSESMQGIKRQVEVNLLAVIGEKMLPALNKFANWLRYNMPTIERIITKTMEIAGYAFSQVSKFISEKLVFAFDMISKWWENNGSSVKEIASNVFDKIVEVAGNVKKFYEEELVPVFDRLKKWWDNNGEVLGGVVSDAFDLIVKAADIVWIFFSESLLPIFDKFSTYVIQNYPEVRDAVVDAFEDIENVVEPVYLLFRDYLMPVFEAVADFMTNDFVTAADIMKGAFDDLLGPIDEAVETLAYFMGLLKLMPDMTPKELAAEALNNLPGIAGTAMGITESLTGTTVGEVMGTTKKDIVYPKTSNPQVTYYVNVTGSRNTLNKEVQDFTNMVVKDLKTRGIK